MPEVPYNHAVTQSTPPNDSPNRQSDVSEAPGQVANGQQKPKSQDETEQGSSQEEKDLEKEDAEHGGINGKPRPVGFWDPSLSKTRKSVLINWVRTSMFDCHSNMQRVPLTPWASLDSLHFHSRHPVPVLGRFVQRAGQLRNSQNSGCRLRWRTCWRDYPAGDRDGCPGEALQPRLHHSRPVGL